MVAALSKSSDDITAIHYLVSCGVDVNQADFQGRTPLYYAVINGNASLTDFLLREGADANCVLHYRKINRNLRKEDIERWEWLLNKVKDLVEHYAQVIIQNICSYL